MQGYLHLLHQEGEYCIPLGSQPCGLLWVDKSVVVGCMDNTLNCYTGKSLWCVKLNTSLQLMDHRPRGFKAVLVALRNCEVRVYRDKYLIVNTIKLEDVVVRMKFGRFVREDGVLLLVMQGGAMAIKIHKRTVSFEAKNPNPSPPKAQIAKLNIPRKTKLFVDQTVRKRENAVAMHVTHSSGTSTG